MPLGEVRVGGDVISLGSVAWEDRAARDLTLNDLRHFHPGLPMSPRASWRHVELVLAVTTYCNTGSPVKKDECLTHL